MISLKRLESMRRWQTEGKALLLGSSTSHAAWAYFAGLLRAHYDVTYQNTFAGSLVPTEALAPAIAKAEAEHARHRTLEQREVNRQRDMAANAAYWAAEPVRPPVLRKWDCW